MNQSRGVVWPAKGQVDLETRDVPEPGAGEVVIESVYTTVSPGTELAWLHNAPQTPGIFPYTPGYTGVGRVHAVGEGVKSVNVGDMVAARMKHAAHVAASANAVHPLPPDADPVAFSAYRLAAIAIQGVRKGEIGLGDRVAVVGLGPIGLMAAQLARAAGAIEVVGFDLTDWRRAKAKDAGVDRVSDDILNEAEDGQFHVVIECTGVPAVVSQSFQLGRRGAAIVVLGSPRGAADGVDFYALHNRGLRLIGAHEGTRANHPADEHGPYRTSATDERTVVQLAGQGRIDLSPLVSEVVSPASAGEAYRRLADHAEQLMCVTFDWST